MKFVSIGQMSASIIGLGTWQIGTNSWGWGVDFGPTDVEKILDAALDSGINLIDTAELYGQGESERQLGMYLADGARDFLIASKVSPWHLDETGVYEAAIRSLERMQRPFVDLYQVHVPNPLMPIRKTMAGMRRLLSENRVREIGVSNFSLKRWKQAEIALGTPIVANQVEYSLLFPNTFNALRTMLDHNHVIIAYSPLAMGLLSGKYNGDAKPSGARSTHPAFSRRNYQNVRRVLEVVEKVAKAHSALTSQIALAWVISHPNVIAIPGAKSVEQVRQNAAAVDIQLTLSEIADLTEVSDSYKTALHVPRVFEAFKWLFSRN